MLRCREYMAYYVIYNACITANAFEEYFYLIIVMHVFTYANSNVKSLSSLPNSV